MIPDVERDDEYDDDESLDVRSEALAWAFDYHKDLPTTPGDIIETARMFADFLIGVECIEGADIGAGV